MKSLRKQVEDLVYEISGDQDHGECFYEEDMLYEFIGKLEKLKQLSFDYYKENYDERMKENE